MKSAKPTIILRPRVTEKSTVLATRANLGPVYTFEVQKGSTKNEVAKAIELLFKVKPVKVAMINLPIKKTFVRGKKGQTAGVRKALVYLAAGQSIDFV
jgi:large subunit ribosomal protein L23